MKVQVRGCNYTGHHFRGIDCAYDGRTVDVTLVGTEQQIVNFVLDNFDWGANGKSFTVSELCEALAHDDQLLAEGFDLTSSDEDDDDAEHLLLGQFDGAGGVVWVKDENGEALFEVGDPEWFADRKVIDLGIVDMNEVDKLKEANGYNSYVDYVNEFVRNQVEKGKA